MMGTEEEQEAAAKQDQECYPAIKEVLLLGTVRLVSEVVLLDPASQGSHKDGKHTKGARGKPERCEFRTLRGGDGSLTHGVGHRSSSDGSVCWVSHSITL
jgi:hypothetical protein